MPPDPADQWYSERDISTPLVISTTLVKGKKVLGAVRENYLRSDEQLCNIA
jgi:hypothetical protein